MALKGIDVASYQAALNVGSIDADFVIAKATQGIDYVNPYCDTHIQQAIASGKKYGVYHFADHGDARAEALYFYNNCQGYIGTGIFVLDWEGIFVDDTAWVKRFCDTFFELSGVRPIIYMSESVVNAHDWSDVKAGNYGLWVAKYRDYDPDYNFDMTNAGSDPSVDWGDAGYVMWQWTSTGRLNGYNANLDCDIFYGNNDTWDAYAKVDRATPETAPAETPPTEQPDQPPVGLPVQPDAGPETPVETPDPTPPVETPLPPIEEPTDVKPFTPWEKLLLAILTGISRIVVGLLKNKKVKK